MYWKFTRDMQDNDKNNTWKWMRKSDLKECTKALIYSFQEQSVQNNYIQYDIDKTRDSYL